MTEYFYFDGVPSSQLGIQIIQAGGGAEDTFPLLGPQNFYEQQVINNDFSSFIRTRKERLQFTLAFMLIGCPPGAPEAVTGQVNDDNLWQLGQFFARSKPIEFMLATDNMISSQRIVNRRFRPALIAGGGATPTELTNIVNIPSSAGGGQLGVGDLNSSTETIMFRRIPGMELNTRDSIVTAVPRVLNIVPTGGIEFVRYIGNKAVWQITFDATTPYWLTPRESFEFRPSGTAPGGWFSFNIINLRNIQDRNGNYDVYPRMRIEFPPEVFNIDDIRIENTTTGRNVAISHPNPLSIRNLLGNENNVITLHHRIVQSRFDSHDWRPPGSSDDRDMQQYWAFGNWNKTPFSIAGGGNTIESGTIGRNNLRVNRPCDLLIDLQVPIF